MNIPQLKWRYPLCIGRSNPFLRAVAKPVITITPQIRKFCRELLELMRAYEGVGLAAPQVAKSVRIAAFTQRNYAKKDRKLLAEGVMINPEVISQSDEILIEKEACLSLPDVTGTVARPARVTVRFQDTTGKVQILKAKGYNARILLHEIDHLDGVLFIDKLTE